MIPERHMKQGRRVDKLGGGELITGYLWTNADNDATFIRYRRSTSIGDVLLDVPVEPSSVEDVAVEPIITTKIESGISMSVYFCPNCNVPIGTACDCHGKGFVDNDYCPDCGQRLLWH